MAGLTLGAASSDVQANMAVLPFEWAYDFLLFCQRNPKPSPLLEVNEIGSPCSCRRRSATDEPRYRV